MSQPALLRGTYIDILVEDPVDSATFTRLCGLNTKQFTYQKNSGDIFIPDCDDPEDVPIRRLNITGRQWDLSGSGYYNLDQSELLRTLVAEGAPRLFRFAVGRTGSDVEEGYWEGPAQLMNVQYGGPAGGEFASLDLTISSDGEFVWVDA